jgi:hypothetical protein
MIIGIHESPYLFMKSSDFMNSLGANNHECLESGRLLHTCAKIPVDCHPQRAPSLVQIGITSGLREFSTISLHQTFNA